MQNVSPHVPVTADRHYPRRAVASRWSHDGLEIAFWNKRESSRHVWRSRSSLSSRLSKSADRTCQADQNCKKSPDNFLLHRPPPRINERDARMFNVERKHFTL